MVSPPRKGKPNDPWIALRLVYRILPRRATTIQAGSYSSAGTEEEKVQKQPKGEKRKPVELSMKR